MPEVTDKEKDLVCGAEIEATECEHTAEYHGKTYYFCSSDCKKKFEVDPVSYIKKVA